MKGRLAVAVVLLVLAGAEASAGETSQGTAVLRASSQSATVGDRIDVTLEVTVPSGWSAERPDPGSELGPFAVSDPSWEGPVPAGTTARYLFKARLAAFEIGSVEIPAIEVRVQGPGGPSVLRSQPLAMEIRSVLEEKEARADAEPEIADLKPPASMPADYRSLYAGLGIFAAILAVAGAAWWLYRRFAPALAAVPAPVDPFRRLPPHVWAYEELKRLLERRLANEGEIGLFFAELSRILKLYLSGRYRVALMERTSGEIPVLLEEAGAPREAIRSARALLERCDGVKFARERPDPERCRASVEEAYRIVDATRPAEEPRSAEKGAA